MAGAGAHSLPDFELTGEDGPKPLSAWMGGADRLIVFHHMGASCPDCARRADMLAGSIGWMRPETEAILCSADMPAAMAPIAAQRGWPLLIALDPDGRFSQAAGFWADGGIAPGASA